MPQSITQIRHPRFAGSQQDWQKWRLTYNGGEAFRRRYLERFTKRENPNDFNLRKCLTPIPNFTKSAVNDIRNAIFQRMGDVLRIEGSKQYQDALSGLDMGVDRRGSTMNSFLGTQVLTDLLVMGAVGVYVDNDAVIGSTLADSKARPYLYTYAVENILAWSCTRPEEPSEFDALLLKDTCTEVDDDTGLPMGEVDRFRFAWINKDTGLVNLQFFDEAGNPITRDGEPGGGPIELQLSRIPFVKFDIGDSLIKDACSYQIALLNLVSSDVWYALKSNFPFYTEQRDGGAVGAHLKPAANSEGTATSGGQGSSDEDINVGAVHGRAYGKNLERPAFIHPSPEPLMASMKLQDKLEQDIRRLVNLAVQTLATRQSAEAKSLDNQGLESGLAYIGLVLEKGERQIAENWAAYEDRVVARRKVATIHYPERYSLKSDGDRIEEATDLNKLVHSFPSRTARKETLKLSAASLLAGKIPPEKLRAIHDEIDKSPFTTSDPDVILKSVEQGVAGEETASLALGYPEGEHLKARADHSARIARIQDAQTSPNGSSLSAGARGVPDLSVDPSRDGKEEKAGSRNTDLQDTTRRRTRGEGS